LVAAARLSEKSGLQAAFITTDRDSLLSKGRTTHSASITQGLLAGIEKARAPLSEAR